MQPQPLHGIQKFSQTTFVIRMEISRPTNNANISHFHRAEMPVALFYMSHMSDGYDNKFTGYKAVQRQFGEANGAQVIYVRNGLHELEQINLKTASSV